MSEELLKTSAAFRSFMKSPHPSFKHTSYFEVYDEIFERFRGKPIVFVEIGILEGGSLFMWRDFFGPEARIIGIDLNPDAKKWEADGFEIYIGSQSDPDFWSKFFTEIGPIDILLDDGGHAFVQQIVTVELALEHIVSGGLLVVEDTHSSYLEGFGDKSKSFIKYVEHLITKINSRSSRFSRLQEDRRIWGVEVFESIVSFRINHTAAQRLSQPIRNKPAVDGNDRFRNHPSNMQAENKVRLDKIVENAFKLYKD